MAPSPENELWIVCPVCYQLNPARRAFCEHCWGAIIRSGARLPYDKAQEVAKRKVARARLAKIIRKIAISFASLFSVAAIVYFGGYYSTGLLVKPQPGISSNSPPAAWAMFRHDQAHSGAGEAINTVPQGIVAWAFSTGASIRSSPAVAEGTVYFGSRDHKLYAVDAVTGEKRWEFKTGSWVESSPAVVNGIVYFGSNDGKLYALDARNGEKLWEFTTAYPIESSPAVANGIVYFGADDFYIYALDAANGKMRWRFETDGPVISSPTVANGIVYVGSDDGFGYALHALNGWLRLHFKSFYPVMPSPVVDGATVYLVNSRGVLYGVNGYARTWPREHEIKPIWLQLWAFGTPGIPFPPPESGLLWRLRVGEVVSSSPAVYGDTLYIGADSKLVAIDLQSKEERWAFVSGDAIISSPAVAGATVYIGSKDGRLYAVDAATGEKHWDILTGGAITSSPAVVDGIVYIGSNDGKLYAIR